MPRQGPVLDDEKRSYGALWLISSLLLFVGALWAIADDNIFRRPWKKWQAEFNRLEIHRLEDAMADEQKRLDADPEYQAAAKALEGVSLGSLPGPKGSPPFFGFDWQPKIPKIQQLVLEEFDRNNFNKPIARVDRCVSCHAGINKAGFEDQPNPWKTHPRRELYLGKDPPDKFGCTPCHGGQGPAVNSVETAHGNFLDKNGHVENVEFIEQPLFRGEKMTANCIKCHAGVQHLDGADEIARGEHLFEELGCHGCHLTEGYEDLAKSSGVSAIGPSLRRIAAKLDQGWMVRWITNPHAFRPRTRMPNLRLSDDEARAITAYLVTLGEKKPAPADLAVRLADPANVAAGEKLVRKYGCAGCHDIPGMERESRIGVELSSFASKTREELFFGDRTDIPETWDDWTYNKLLLPRTYATKWIEQVMPQFDLADEDIKALRAFLASRTDAKVPVRYAYHAPGEERIIAARRLA